MTPMGDVTLLDIVHHECDVNEERWQLKATNARLKVALREMRELVRKTIAAHDLTSFDDSLELVRIVKRADELMKMAGET